MPAIAVRSEALEAAARLVQRGDLDRAVRAYARLFEQDRRDWNVANTLGDLYVRAGRPRDGVAHFTSLAEQLATDGFAAKARALYRKILRIQPDNAIARQRIGELDGQDRGAVSPFLKRVLETARASRDAAAPDPEPHGIAPVTETPSVETPPVAAPVVAQPARHMAPSTDRIEAAPDVAPSIVEEVRDVAAPAHVHPPAPHAGGDPYARLLADADAASRRRDYREARDILEQILEADPQHVVALETLVEVCVDGEFDADLQSAQLRLATACLKAHRYRQAWEAAADLVIRHPADRRFREAFSRIDAMVRSRGVAVPRAPELDEEVEAPHLAVEPPPAPPVAAPHVAVEPPPAPPVAAPTPAPDDLLTEWRDTVAAFETIRNTLLDEAAAAAEELFSEASRHLDAQRTDAAIRALEEAMCAPHLRTAAGARLAEIYREAHAPLDALACLEWVAQVPPGDADSSHALAYELAVTLEALGQEAQALGVYRELVAEVGEGYRDLATRLQRLAA